MLFLVIMRGKTVLTETGIYVSEQEPENTYQTEVITFLLVKRPDCMALILLIVSLLVIEPAILCEEITMY